MTDCQYPRDYTDRQLLESIWHRIDGLSMMLTGPIQAARRAAEVSPTERTDDG